MELTAAFLNLCHSDPITVALPANILLETAYAVGDIKNDPVRIPVNLFSSATFALATTGALKLAGVESAEAVEYAAMFGYAFPSAVRLVTDLVSHNQESGKIIPFALSATAAAGIGLVNMAIGSLDIYNFAQVDKFRSAMHFFGNALSQFGNKLPSYIDGVKNINK
ncbi:MAG: hypothetical protein NTV98_02765 [Candidatus Roizmanbacteria bacterium]|nr:hypothetical protein [Candidatus Roizmanbacteria bacterium]